ncbi:hypothetical protein PoB_003184500 [Plakobranchus ocellatus]|uniref:Uncharacterized protein n=1 Tax=Plakobranchus ocellatus TaxID=259542 RepID=A0AAV4AF02_9GAST|nr:hypothetical protein PoB_003184500 [Plakobranchus ocellatus]
MLDSRCSLVWPSANPSFSRLLLSACLLVLVPVIRFAPSQCKSATPHFPPALAHGLFFIPFLPATFPLVAPVNPPISASAWPLITSNHTPRDVAI